MTNKRKLYQTFLMTMVMMLLFPLTAAAENVGYAVFNSVSGTLTFKYGEKPADGENETVYGLKKGDDEPEWIGINESINKVVFDASFSEARPTTCAHWFCQCTKLKSIEGIEYLNTSSVTNMIFMFASCNGLTSLDLSYFDTSKVTEMIGMFEGCGNLTTIYVSNNFKTSQVQNSDNMFAFCESLKGIIAYDGGLNLDKTYANFTNGYFLAVPYVQIIGSFMYFKCDGNVKPEGAYSLNEGTQTPGWSDKASEISFVIFDESFKNICPTSCNKWFSGFSNLTKLNLSSLNTSKVTDMSEMFKGCSGLTQIIVSDKFTTDNVQSSNDMFAGCTNLEGIINKCDGINNIDKTYANFTNGYLSAEPYVTLSDGVLTFKCDGAKPNGAFTLSDGGFQVWYDLTGSITKAVFDESFKNARPTNCSDWFFEAKYLNTIEGFENFNTSKVTNMREMFKKCHALKSLDLTNFDTSNVTDMGSMFYDCPGLTTIYVSDKFTTDKVQKLEEMFSGCTSLSGAIRCDGTNNIDGTYANYITGYFTCGIKSADDLASFAERVNTADKDGGEAVLLNDITMTAEDNFTPITRKYTGKFDGKGHTIGGLNFSESNNYLFAQNGGTIKNLGIVNAKVAEGATGSICQTNGGTIEKCFFMGTTTSSEETPQGAVCQTNNGTITHCYYLASNEDSKGGKTKEQFEGGAVCYLLNDGMTDGTQTWYQNIDNGANDAYPVIDNTHGTVYQCTPCTGVYSNTENKEVDHLFGDNDNGFCHHCGIYQPATLNASNQYEIGNAGQLYWFAGLVNGDASVCDYNADSNQNGTKQNKAACAVLTANIVVNSGLAECKTMLGSLVYDASGNVTNGSNFVAWTPIGFNYENYTGTFDGKGYTVSGLYFNDTSKEKVGLFGRVDSGGKISNVGVLDSYFQFKMFGGGVCGFNCGEINNCYSFSKVISTNGYGGGVCGYNDGGKILNSYNNGIVSGYSNTGGVCGISCSGTIENCHNEGAVSGTDNYTGGVCGQAQKGAIKGSYNTASVSGVISVGGVCGYNEGAALEGCHNTGSVSGKNYVGGVCGHIIYTGTITNCYNSGTVSETVSGYGYNAGVCGLNENCTIFGCYNTGAVSGYVSGGVCSNNYGTIINCYNTGTVSGQTFCGGVCGHNYKAGTVMSCYNRGAVDGKDNDGGICGGIHDNSSITNCYFDSNIYSGNAIGSKQGGTVGEDVMGKTTAQFKSGEVCYLLSQGSTIVDDNTSTSNFYSGAVWGQQLGVNNYPLASDYKVLRAARDGENGTNYWATFSNLNSNAELTAPTGNVTVYNATVSAGTLTLAKRSDNRVAAGEGVLLKAGCEYLNAKNISDEVSAAATGENHLVATPKTAETITANTGCTLYRLTYNKTATKEGLGFYLGVVGDSKDGSKLAATPGKAYLNVSTQAATEPSTAKLARGFAFTGDDDATGIECITVTDESSHRNGNADDIFDLQGRKVSKPTKGLYIKNNRVVFKLKN